MRKSLVALDTDHIKEYVFGTDKLKEIRGASSLLDRLNRIEMGKVANNDDIKAVPVYMNGGSGLFVVDTDKADLFGHRVQQEYMKQTGGVASVTYVVQELPESAEEDIWNAPVKMEIELLGYLLREAKDHSPDIIALPSHPFMRLCDACGVEYAEEKDNSADRDFAEQDALYCASCLEKRQEDIRVKKCIEEYVKGMSGARQTYTKSPLWHNLIEVLRNVNYWIPPDTKRPNDFNVFRNFKGAKDYFGLIYADANGMGKKIEGLSTLKELQKFDEEVDDAIYRAVGDAIEKYLRVGEQSKQDSTSQGALFPFDILLLGGDDVMMVVPAPVAMDVALTIAESFYHRTNEKHTLSVGVVLSPIKYPFGLLQKLVSSTLKFAKMEGAKKAKAHTTQRSEYGNTLINFMVVTGSTSLDFKKVYTNLSDKKVPVSVAGRSQQAAFYATLRPYTPEQLRTLLDAIREGNKLGLGRTKLHQVREAVLKMNLSTSVSEGLAVLRNWRVRQREYVVNHIYTLGGIYQIPYRDEQNPASLFPRVTFPWFADGEKTYRTSLLDFVELYDFVAREEGDGDDEG